MTENIPCYFLNVYKPKGITSFDVIYKLRKRLSIKKIGHAGTLDPMAEGVMQVAVGSASRLLEYLPSDKEYEAEIQFGYISSTLDAEGEIKEAEPLRFNKKELEEKLEHFKGKIKQIPPKFSAIKINGKKLCDIARKNPEIEIEIPEREIEIYNIKLLDFKETKATIKVSCSKGTYIRTLAQDIAQSLGTSAYLTKLIRTKAGNFNIKDSIQIDEINPEINAISPRNALNLEEYILAEEEFNLVKNGVSFSPKNKPDKEILSLIYKNNLVSIGIFVDNKIKIKKFFGTAGDNL